VCKTELLAKFSNNKRLEISKLGSRALTNDTIGVFCDALDALIPFKGLWSAFQLGHLHTLLGQHCFEVGEDIKYPRCTAYTSYRK
jgi:hypothetical protein